MASSANIISVLLLITILSMQVHGRESQFFSKVSNTNSQQKVPEKEVTPSEKKEEKDPEFVPENQNSGYGLYGHETGSGELPSTTTANFPHKPESEEYNSYPNTQNNNYYDNRYSFNGENQNEFGNSKFSQSGYDNQKAYFNGGKNNYNVERQGMSDTRFLENGKYFYGINSEKNQNEFGNSKFSQSGYDNQKAYLNGGKNDYNVERQGMSDTRFLENGKYFYDINSEKNQNSNQYENAKNELPTSWNLNKNGGYYGQNNQNSYEYRNSMGGYQNNEEPEQFQFQQNEFEP